MVTSFSSIHLFYFSFSSRTSNSPSFSQVLDNNKFQGKLIPIVAISDFFSQPSGELRRCLIDWPKGPQGLDQKPLPLHPGVRALQHVSGKTLLMCPLS